EGVWSCVAERGATLGRVGGARLALILPEATPGTTLQMAEAIVQRLREEVAALPTGAPPAARRVLVGAALFTGAQTAEELQIQAEAALRNAELSDNQPWHLFAATETVEPATLNESEQWKLLLRHALDSGEVVLAAQEVRALSSDDALHIELLARFQGTDGRLVPAGVLVPVAANLGLSAALDKLIVNALLEVVAQRPENFAVNLSAGSLEDRTFTDWLMERLRSLPLDQRSRLSFETSEYAALTHPSALRRLAEGVRKLDVRFGLDHCGAADVSLKPLQQAGIDYAKLCGGLIQGMDQNRDQRELVRSLVALGHGLDVLMVAEHIETESELEIARALGLDGAQGYYIGKPEPLTPVLDAPEPKAPTDMPEVV
ncbi:MAG: GGDEF domain-containing protein, partial [Gammaproteobacteria bacterium]|nr:GGDEF domain-containing protein [Gammaproteobacteria bacterium]